jgi:hypothetical protein
LAINPGTARLAALSVVPSAPPAGYCLIYFKANNILYIQDSSGIETPVGTSAGITALTGDVVATGPGSAIAAVQFVGGKTSAQVAAAVNAYIAATPLNVANTIVQRDASDNFAAGIITAALNGAASANVLKSGDTMSGPLIITNNSAAALVVDGNVFVVDGANNRIGINQLNPTEALDVIGNGKFSGTIIASNLSGNNNGDVTVLSTATVNLTLFGQNISADVKLSNSTIISDANGIKVGIVPAVSISGLAAVATSGLAFDVGLGNVSNTSDINKPVSTAQGIADSAVQSFSIQRLNHTGTQTSSTISDFVEAAQDAVGGSLIDTATIDMTYDDAGNSIKADVRLSD